MKVMLKLFIYFLSFSLITLYLIFNFFLVEEKPKEQVIKKIKVEEIEEDVNIDISINTGEDIKILKKLYLNAVLEGDEISQLNLLLKIFGITKEENLKFKIYKKALSLNRFKFAYNFAKKYGLEIPLEEEVFLYLNFADFGDQNFRTKYIELINKLDEQKKNLYLAYLDLLDFNFELFYQKIKNLSDVNDFLKSYEIYNSYKDTSLAYLEGLLSYNLFNRRLYKLAIYLATSAYKKYSNYILANQVLGYIYYLYGDIKAEKYLYNLIKLDKDNEDLYKFLIGIIYFDKKDYNKALLYFLQIKDGFEYYKDVLRYIFLSYLKLLNEKADNVFKELVNKGANIYDFWTYFEYGEFLPSYYEVIKICYKTLFKHQHYICRYGYSKYLIKNGQKDKAYKYVLKIIDYYPYEIFYKFLGDYEFENKNFEKAKEYYIKAYKISENKEYYKRRIIQIFKLKDE